MLFASYPTPSGYAPPPRRNANPVMIVLGICGGCALVAIIAIVIGGVFLKRAAGPFLGRTVKSAQFAASLQMRKYDDAERFLSPQAQQTYPVEALRKKLEALEAKNGRLTGFAQVNNIVQGQDPRQIKELTYNFNFQNGTVVPLKVGFEDTPGQESDIAHLDWGRDDSAGSGNNMDSGETKVPGKRRGAHKSGAGNDSGG